MAILIWPTIWQAMHNGEKALIRMRINKYLSACGLCSRREADRLLEAGRVSLNGKTAENGMQVEEEDVVCVDGKKVVPLTEKTYLKLYKPVGIVCTSDTREKDNVIDFIRCPVRVTYAGRLDRNSEGLLLLTDDGSLIETLMRPGNEHEKEYEVTVTRVLTSEELDILRAGVWLEELNRKTRPCRVEHLEGTTYRFVLTQGLNRQIRRMCKCLGIGIRKLKRVRVASVKLGDMKPGELRVLTADERRSLEAAATKTALDR